MARHAAHRSHREARRALAQAVRDAGGSALVRIAAGAQD